MDDSECLQYAIGVFKKLAAASNFNRVAKQFNYINKSQALWQFLPPCLRIGALQCRPIAADPRSLQIELTIDEEHVNGKGTLHGGQTAALVDIITATAVGITVRDRGMVSVDMSISYLLPVLRGDTVVIDARVLKNGRTMAFTEAEFRRKSDGALVAKGRQTLAFIDAKKSSGSSTTVENSVTNGNCAAETK